jgi:hypothetical protein
MKLRPCEILQPSAAINQSQAAILGWSTIYSGFVWTCSPVCTIAGPDLLDIWVCPKLGWWSPKFHLPIKRESPLNGCGSENNMKKTWEKTFSPKFIIMFSLGHFTWEPCPLDQHALFGATSWPTTCQVAIEVNVWDAGVEIIDGQCCRGGLFREAWWHGENQGSPIWRRLSISFISIRS